MQRPITEETAMASSPLRIVTLILTTTLAVSCRPAAPPLPPPVGVAGRSAANGTRPSGTTAAALAIPALNPALLPAQFLERLRERSVSLDRIPSTYTTTALGRPAISMSTGTFALMNEASIRNRRWTPPPGPAVVLDVVPSTFHAYIASNAYVNGINPANLGIPLPPESVIHEIPPDMPIRQQSPPRLTCVAHASIAAMEIRNDVPNDLSEQYAHHVFLQNLKQPTNCCDDGDVFVLDAAHDLENVGIPVENDFRYTADFPACKGRSGFPCLEDNPHPQTLPLFSPRYRVTDIGEIPEGFQDATIGNVGYLESILASGFDIVIEVGIAWIDDKKPGTTPDNIIDVLLLKDQNNMPLPPAGFHAMLLTGYDRNRHFFIARNSMGAGWGLHNGEAWLSYNYLTTYAVAGYIIKNVVRETGK
jgi:hypothetical protein